MKANVLLGLMILIVVVAGMLTSSVAQAAINNPKVLWGTVQNSNGSAPSPGDITFSAHIESRPAEILTQASPGCGVESNGPETQYIIECGNFATQWQAGDVLLIAVTNAANYEWVTVNLTLAWIFHGPRPCKPLEGLETAVSAKNSIRLMMKKRPPDGIL